MAKDYYQLLDVDTDATQDQIKSAYRSKVKHLHPDHFQGSSGPFRAVQEAYEVLGDPTRRQHYDEELLRAQGVRRATSGAEPLSHRRESPAEPLVPDRRSTGQRDAFFDAPFPFPLDEVQGRPWGPPRQLWAEPTQEIHVQVSLSPEQAQRGGRVRLLIPMELQCPNCGGRRGDWFFGCRRCIGRGVLTAETPVDIAFPARVADGFSGEVSLRAPDMRDVLVILHFRINRW